MVVQGHPGKKVHETPSQQQNLGKVVYACHANYSRNHKIRGYGSGQPWQNQDPTTK
jgi:hypothetical protein